VTSHDFLDIGGNFTEKVLLSVESIFIVNKDGFILKQGDENIYIVQFSVLT
jgi:hypothetical protein